MNQEEDDSLWKLLGKAREPVVPPFFASKVLRAIREQSEARPGVWVWLRRRWFVPLGAAAACTVAAFFAFHTPPVAPAGDPLEEMAGVVASSGDTMPSLNELLASQDHSIWLEADSSSLY